MKPGSFARYLLGMVAAVGLLTGCDLIKFHPYEGRVEGAHHLTEKNLQKLSQANLGSSFKFAFISDTQRWYDETNEAVAAINRRGDVDFVLHGGDLTDFGVKDEFIWMRDCLLGFRMPWLTVIGNHDFLGTGEHIYQYIFGDYNYAFTVGHYRFLILNTVALELDYSTPVPDFEFMQKQAEYIDSLNTQTPDSIIHTVFVMHSRPGDEQFNNNVVYPFGLYLNLFPAPFCLNGHNHRLETIEPYNDGIYFYGIGEIKDRKYFLITVNQDSSYEIEAIDF